MKAQLYGNRQPLWKANQMWRASRAKHIKRDLQQTQQMTNAVFGGQFQATYERNAMILRIATQRTLKSV